MAAQLYNLPMRNVVYSVAASLDGYIAGPSGEYDWIPEEPEIDWDGFMSRFDTVLMGRGTYELVRAQGSGASMLETYVFSATLAEVEDEAIHLVREDAEGVVKKLRRGKGKEIWLMGGGVLFRSLLEAGLVDRIEVAVVPILLGGGIPLLPEGAPRTKLTLVESKRYEESGIVGLTYEVGQ